MSAPYVGQILMFAGTFAPAGWMTCQGQVIPISENETLFQLIGTTYGGDGQETFALPDLQGRVPIHQGSGPGLSTYDIGQSGGVETVTLTPLQIPLHNHLVSVNTAAAGGTTKTANATTILANEGYSGGVNDAAFVYAPPGGATANMAASSVQNTGGSQPHENIQPVIAVTYIISLFGVFPTPA